VAGFVQDALRADSETEWSCHSRTLSIKRMVLGFVQDALAMVMIYEHFKEICP